MSQFGTPFRQNKPPKEIAEKPLRSDLTTAPFPHYSLQTLSPILPVPHIPCPASHVPPILKYGVGTWTGTVGVLCFVFGFDASSRTEKAHGTGTDIYHREFSREFGSCNITIKAIGKDNREK